MVDWKYKPRSPRIQSHTLTSIPYCDWISSNIPNNHLLPFKIATRNQKKINKTLRGSRNIHKVKRWRWISLFPNPHYFPAIDNSSRIWSKSESGGTDSEITKIYKENYLFEPIQITLWSTHICSLKTFGDFQGHSYCPSHSSLWKGKTKKNSSHCHQRWLRVASKSTAGLEDRNLHWRFLTLSIQSQTRCCTGESWKRSI